MAPSAPTKGDEIPVEGKENMKAEVRKCKEEEKIKLEQREEKEESEGKKKEEESEEQSLSSSSPRGVLEIPISGSDDSDNSSNISCERSSSFGSYSDEKTTTIVVEKGGGGGGIISRESYAMQWKSLVDTIKKSSAKRLAIFGGGNDVSKRGLRKRLGRNHSAEEGSLYVEDFVVPKPSWRNFSYEELSQATHNFSPDKLIGKGGHAEVYKGCLSDGQIVAVKKITKQEKNDEDRVGDFLSELGIIAHINHPHAAKLIGFSSESDLHLVLDFLPHGSLASLLHGSNESLEWKLRHKVAVGVAEGLQYLHCDCQRRIIHRDITATNILLTEDYEPQISDFGLAKWLPEKWIHHVVSPIEGTFGYMAPEYFMHGILNEKTDVFAFGVLLLELITGRHAVDSSGQSLVIWAKPLLEKNNIKEIVDPRLGHNYDVIEMKRAIYTAETCIHHLPNMRPNMKRVIQLLKGEKDLLDMKQKSMGERALLLDACDLDEYSSTTYLKDLNRHMELVME